MDGTTPVLLPAATHAPSPVRVLVADDEDDIRALVCLAVAKAGCTVLAKPFGVAALVHQVRALTAGQPA